MMPADQTPLKDMRYQIQGVVAYPIFRAARPGSIDRLQKPTALSFIIPFFSLTLPASPYWNAPIYWYLFAAC